MIKEKELFEQMVKGHKLMKRYLDFMVNQFSESVDPQKIQGYTAEQWQEIIDGGYLCQVRDAEIRPWVPSELVSIDGKPKMEFIDNCGDGWKFCRPAQLKGAMRPIFVEPVDKEADCVFFAEEGNLFCCKFNELPRLFCATKYIEL